MSARDGSKIPQNPHASIVFFSFKKNKDMVLVLCRPLASKAHHQHPQDSEVLSAKQKYSNISLIKFNIAGLHVMSQGPCWWSRTEALLSPGN